MSLTFVDIISAWGKGMNDKDSTGMEAVFSNDFTWQSAVPDDRSGEDPRSNKTESIEWTLGADLKIGDYHTIYNGSGVVSGTHSAIIEGVEHVVFCQGILTDDGRQVKSWRHLIGDYPE
jgi:hypothetical protein